VGSVHLPIVPMNIDLTMAKHRRRRYSLQNY
jgi:hypothetical protein